MLHPLLIALQLMTRLPLQIEPAPTAVETGRSLLWYPTVGLGIGVIMCINAEVLLRFIAPTFDLHARVRGK
jgi:adenosylcobinamide-GDP ribazoletransferase